MARSECSEEVSSEIDRCVRSMVFESYETARRLIGENRQLLDRLVDILLDQETIEGEQFREIVSQYTNLPDHQKTSS